MVPILTAIVSAFTGGGGGGNTGGGGTVGVGVNVDQRITSLSTTGEKAFDIFSPVVPDNPNAPRKNNTLLIVGAAGAVIVFFFYMKGRK